MNAGSDLSRRLCVEEQLLPASVTTQVKLMGHAPLNTPCDQLAQPSLRCSVGVMAHNEAANIGSLLDALLVQRTSLCEIAEIVVIASGCTDATEEIVGEFSRRDRRVKLLLQARREGKASAINLFLRYAKSDILVLESADTVPLPTTIERLVAPFTDPEIGMTGGRPVPTNDPATFIGFAAHLLWDMHHQIALRQPKMGEVVAFRRVFQQIPVNSAVDEANIEPLVRGQGYRLHYVPDAIVYNHGPERVTDLLKQRRRIYAGHLRVRQELGYAVSTMSVKRTLSALLRCWRWEPRFFIWTPAVIALELCARLLGWIDYAVRRRDHAIWDIAVTTKQVLK